MHFHVLTLFPEMIEQGMNTSIMGRAIERGYISLKATDIRDYAANKHNKVDDTPYGGGAGMVMQAAPVYGAYEAVKEQIGYRPRVIYLTPQGSTFSQPMAEEFAKEQDLVFLCGHYEGIDERVLEEIVTDYVSIGDYVLTGGELPAMVMMDAISRLVPGVLHNEASAEFESFQGNLLEHPHYRFRKCCYPDIMPTLKNGEENSPSSGRQKEDRICWKKRICQQKKKLWQIAVWLKKSLLLRKRYDKIIHVVRRDGPLLPGRY